MKKIPFLPGFIGILLYVHNMSCGSDDQICHWIANMPVQWHNCCLPQLRLYSIRNLLYQSNHQMFFLLVEAWIIWWMMQPACPAWGEQRDEKRLKLNWHKRELARRMTLMMAAIRRNHCATAWAQVMQWGHPRRQNRYLHPCHLRLRQ